MAKTLVRVLIFSLLFANFAFAGPGYFTYEGFLTDASGNPVGGGQTLPVELALIGESGGVQCVLVTDSRSVTFTDGNFAIRFGSNAASLHFNQTGRAIADFYDDSKTSGGLNFSNGSACTFDPVSGTGVKRLLNVKVNGETFASVVMSSAPNAMVADRAMTANKLGTTAESEVLRFTGVNVAPLSNTEYAKLTALLSGSSGDYVHNGSAIPLAGDVTGTSSAAVVSKIQGRAISATAPTDKALMKWDQSASQWIFAGLDWNEISGKPSTFQPATHSHSASDITSGVFDISRIPTGTTGTTVALGNDARFTDSRMPNGFATGDLGGSYPSPTVAKIQGKDIATTAPSNGQVLTWNNSTSKWEPQTPTAGAGVTSVNVTPPIKNTGTAIAPIIGVNDATTAAKGVVQLASSSDTTSGLVIQANDTRLSDPRSPTAHTHNVDDINSAPGKYFSYKPNGTACAPNEVLKWDNSNARWICGTGFPASGSANQVLGLNAAGTATEYKTLTAGAGISITPGVNSVTIAASGGSESTMASNVGSTGTGVFKQMVGTALEFKKLAPASSAVTIADDGTGNVLNIGVNTELNGLSLLTSNGFVKRISTGAYSAATSIGVSDLNFAATMPVNQGLVVRDGTQLYNKTCAANETLIWTVANGWSCSPVVLNDKVGANTTNYLPKWNGTALVSSGLTENASGFFGIGTPSPNSPLDVAGTIRTDTICDRTGGNCKTISGGWGPGGSVTSVSVNSLNGFSGTVSAASTTPSITLATTVNGMLKGNGTALAAASAGIDYAPGTAALASGILKSTAGTGAISIATPTDFPTLNQNTTGTAANVTGVVSVTNGGTGMTSVANNALLVGTGTSALTTISPSATGVLYSNGTSWSVMSPGSLTVDLSSAQTITGAKTFTGGITATSSSASPISATSNGSVAAVSATNAANGNAIYATSNGTAPTVTVAGGTTSSAISATNNSASATVAFSNGNGPAIIATGGTGGTSAVFNGKVGIGGSATEALDLNGGNAKIGYEQAANTCVVNQNNQATCTATCSNPNARVVGGGCAVEAYGPGLVVQTAPYSLTSYKCWVTNQYSQAYNFTVTAICLNVR